MERDATFSASPNVLLILVIQLTRTPVLFVCDCHLFISIRRARSFVFRGSVRLRFLRSDRAADTAFPCINAGYHCNNTKRTSNDRKTRMVEEAECRIEIKAKSERNDERHWIKPATNYSLHNHGEKPLSLCVL